MEEMDPNMWNMTKLPEDMEPNTNDIFQRHSVDGGNPKQPPGIYKHYKPCEEWDKLPTSTGEFAECLNHLNFIPPYPTPFCQSILSFESMYFLLNMRIFQQNPASHVSFQGCIS